MSDYIEREAVLSHYKKCSFAMVKAVIAYIEDIPAADVVPVRHGRWISWEEADNCVPSASRHECSICHDAAQVLVNGVELLSVYCPNCGAKMDKTEDRACANISSAER